MSLQFASGRKYRIELNRLRGFSRGRFFSIKFTDAEGEVKRGSATITKLADRLRRLLVQEI